VDLAISHSTRYIFAHPVQHGLQRLRLRPKSTHGQEVRDWQMDFEGAYAQAEYDDQNNNHVVLITIEPGVTEMAVTCKGLVTTVDQSGVIGEHVGHMPLWCFLRPTSLTRAGLRVRNLVAGIDADKSDKLGFLHVLSTAIAEAVEYVPGSTTTETSAEQALVNGRGVCQDHAHIFISAGRLLDIPMRYVGGYLKMDDRIEQDAGHGWAEAWVEGLGWVGFDISNKMCPDERYVRVATGCDYSEAAPVKGIDVGAGETEMEVHLSVEQKMVSQQQQQGPDGQQQSQSG
jgi:transglutaminase-like putative cysteine protease